MKISKGHLVIVGIVLLLGAWLWPLPEVRHGPGVLAPMPPIQVAPPSTDPWEANGYTLTPLAAIDLRARVLSKARYYMGREVELSKYDLALGWGKMSDESVIDRIDISQSGRWFHWRTSSAPPIPVPELTRSAGNFHIIAGNDDVWRQLKSLRIGHIIDLTGSLVRVNHGDGWRWVSSLTRHDTGDGSCEVVWVESIRIVDTATARAGQ